MLFGANAEVLVRDGIAVGLHEPWAGKAALPLCEEHDTARSTSSEQGSSATAVTNMVSQTSTTYKSMTSTLDVGSSTASTRNSTSANVTETSNNHDGGAGLPQTKPLSTEAKISLALGIPGAIVALLTLFRFVRKNRGHGREYARVGEPPYPMPRINRE